MMVTVPATIIQPPEAVMATGNVDVDVPATGNVLANAALLGGAVVTETVWLALIAEVELVTSAAGA